MGTRAQFGIEPEFEPDGGYLGDGRSNMRRNTAADGLHLLTQWCHGNQHTEETGENESRGVFGMM